MLSNIRGIVQTSQPLIARRVVRTLAQIYCIEHHAAMHASGRWHRCIQCLPTIYIFAIVLLWPAIVKGQFAVAVIHV